MRKLRTLELQEFVDEIYVDFINNPDTQYIFFLGAGCSKSSGIPLASELAKEWYEGLRKQTTKFDKFNKKNTITNTKKLDFGKFYFPIFEELFPTPLSQQKEIQRITNDDNVSPSLGYYVLASLMQNPQFNTIVTTNFDNLIQDALIYSGNKRALMITHQDLAKFIKRDNTPLITKVHGDAHMHPFNNSEDTKVIPQDLKGAIQSLFTNTKVICIGYGGNDESIADLLEGCSRIDQVYWLNSSEPKNVKLSEWWKHLSGKTYINEYDFDKIMNVIKSKFTIKAPDFNELARKLQDSYDYAIKEEIEDIEQIDNKTALDYFILGNTYYAQKTFDKAVEAYQKVIEIDPKNANAHHNMGVAYTKLEMYDNAMEIYQKAIEINPKDASAYYSEGVVYSKQNKHTKAIEAYQKAIEINPKDAASYYNIGVEYGNEKKYDQAIKAYQKAIEIDPKMANAYYGKGFAYGQQKKYDKAIEAYQKAIELNPKDANVYYSMGVDYGKQEKYDKAIEAYQKAIELNPKDAESYTNLFEIQLFQEVSLSEDLEKKYVELFMDDKNQFIKFDMLKILTLINQNIDVDLEEWLGKYNDQTLNNWSFNDLDRWINNKKEGKVKDKLLEAIEVFKTKVP